jgi:hypothetical protein
MVISPGAGLFAICAVLLHSGRATRLDCFRSHAFPCVHSFGKLLVDVVGDLAFDQQLRNFPHWALLLNGIDLGLTPPKRALVPLASPKIAHFRETGRPFR